MWYVESTTQLNETTPKPVPYYKAVAYSAPIDTLSGELYRPVYY